VYKEMMIRIKRICITRGNLIAVGRKSGRCPPLAPVKEAIATKVDQHQVPISPP
jgi:hypothetical protein